MGECGATICWDEGDKRFVGEVIRCGDVSLACGRGVLTFAREGAKFIGVFEDGE